MRKDADCCARNSCFWIATSAPTADEQLSHYREIADAFAGKPVVIRTLDIGGDKPVAYIPLPREENPALGLRGIRVSLQQQELLREQLTAILRIDGGARCRILLPMINDASEIRAVRKIVDEIRRSLGRSESIPIGAMIETPAAALCAREIAAEADFLSIGTNDLTQYTLAIDRGHPQLSSQFDAAPSSRAAPHRSSGRSGGASRASRSPSAVGSHPILRPCRS